MIDDDAEDDEGDTTRFGPRRELLAANGAAATASGRGGKAGSSAAEDGKPGIYRPPKINPVSMEE